MTVILSLISGVYFLWFITILSEEKTTENIKIQAVSFSTENDPEAEHLLLGFMAIDFLLDTVLNNMMKRENFEQSFKKISDYLHGHIFHRLLGQF